MRGLLNCALNGHGLEEIGPGILLTDAREHAPRIRQRQWRPAGREGLLMGPCRRESLTVTLVMELHEPSPERRKARCRDIARWALPGGWLTLSDRPGQRLRVRCDAPPTLTSALQWTQPVTVSFTACASPYWEDALLTTAILPSGTAGEAAIRLPGDVPAPVSVEAIASGEVNELTLTVGEQSIRLMNLGLQPGETLRLFRDEDGTACVRIAGGQGERSALDRRDPLSAEELWLNPGETVRARYAADGAAVVRFRAAARYL